MAAHIIFRKPRSLSWGSLLVWQRPLLRGITLSKLSLVAIAAQLVPLGGGEKDCLSHDGILVGFGTGILGIIT